MMSHRLAHTGLLFFPLLLPAQQEIAVWPGLPPGTDPSKAGVEHSVRIVANSGERVVSNVHKPTLTIYLPPKEKATGAAVLVIPGGGHRELWTDHEGHNVAKWLVERGVAGFVLKHRLAREKDSTYTIQGESLADTRQALQVIQGRALEWNLRTSRVGVMGFSAGGELAALLAASPDQRPAFQALIYPAIPKDLAFQKDATPPAFLACGENDRQNISQGLPELYLAMKKAGVSVELHVYANTGHGFGVRPTNKGAAAGWLQRFHEWMDTRGLLAP
jgi:acetyl esterase/lipase